MGKRILTKNNKQIRFYVADYPDVDPNVVHNYDDLIEAGYSVKGKKHSYIEDEAKYRFGIGIDVVTKDYDYDKIQQDFVFCKPPIIESRSKYTTVFTDGTVSIAIKKHELSKYVKTVTRNLFVFKRTEIYNLSADDELYNVLRTLFIKERGIEPTLEDTYFLSRSMLSETIIYRPSLDLLKYYDVDNPNLFFSINSEK